MNKTVGIVVVIAAVVAIGSVLTVQLANALSISTGSGLFGAPSKGFNCTGGPRGLGGGGGTGTGGSGGAAAAGSGGTSNC